jgi:hypothetical protein
MSWNPLSKSDNNEAPQESIARDLCTLQINTILKSHITGSSMPAIRFALCDIASRYGEKLMELGLDFDAVKPQGKTQGGFSRFDLFQRLAKGLSKTLRQENKPQENAAKLNTLQRIQNNSNQLKALLKGDTAQRRNELTRVEIRSQFDKGLKDLELERKDHLTVRKLWELGLETIAIQTVIELDGDVTTRIQPQYSTDDNVTLHKLHHSSVDLSYNYWLSLIKLIGEVFNTVLKNVFKAG